ncbi:MAG: DUF3563 family protein [Burkholderiales bacterium]|nr:DUF3563 family protein [Burkholderiales bacterium]MDE2454795.1 DUF3563 family protein [Burkholderiales bacterium]
MSNFFKFAKTLFARQSSREELDEAYLAQSVDLLDLERRMRDLDRRAPRLAPETEIGGWWLGRRQWS